MSKRKRKQVSGSKNYYLQKIDELSKEISELEEECDQREKNLAQKFSLKTLDEVVKKLSLTTSTDATRDYKSQSNTEEEINSLLTIKEKLETLTGFVFEEDKALLVSSTDDNNNETTKCWRRLLTGKCLDLSFEVDFITEEKQVCPVQDGDTKEQGQISAKISKLQVKIDDPLAKDELEIFISNAEQERSLGTVLQVLSQYSQYYSSRYKTFHHFNTKYPEYVCFLNGPKWSNFMELRNVERNGLHFTVCWEIHIDKFGNVVPQIDAFVCSPVEVEGADDVVSSTPEQFRKILSQFGVEEAIELLISIVKE
ncbi:centromere protein P isoform X2 [Exaiptasia diaphana]|uniref:Centromere protein P n=1 Tax=Exaiptasia diaphana TaxID=2652724 RepID=A0A913YUC6_EXADI|nr:centromere protein P isoform X1 [Exaiptasia diaphana]XP_028518809.1 centromere protein P isoform X2 [Exaiptasia diaphana]KXJ07054.1 Centromere protein P [Exaiptasia diaphana]